MMENSVVVIVKDTLLTIFESKRDIEALLLSYSITVMMNPEIVPGKWQQNWLSSYRSTISEIRD